MAEPIIVERVFDTSVSKIWSAITDKDEMRAWYFNLTEFQAEPGFKFQFTGGPSEDTQYVHLCEVTEVIPQKKLTYSWRYEGYEGNSFVTFELFDQGDCTLLKLTHEGLDTFPDNPDFAINNFVKGWNHIIHTSLKGYLETQVY